ncbi:hypothetical protein [Zymomonas mobilis]|uniref:hypothetical protein n=1 Tax=Zymomonas mobilis TaxID=542 RepID=UPI001174FF82|nr:hypothetical protein [Zymomonas mobilis]MDX5949568.1 hypothetical protein [Zymomonas mobilis subsp. pomaceae]GEB90105.1 hypothetical protein ZMO02_17420 [Zymomonas mobilis subsp. pomaceae]
MLTLATKAQRDISRSITKQLEMPSLDDIKAVILQCLNRDPNGIRFGKKALVGIKMGNELRLDSSKLAVWVAVDFTRSNQHKKAISKLEKEINKTPDTQSRHGC